MIYNKRKDFMRLYTPIHDSFERFCKARAYGSMNFKDLMQDAIVVAFEKGQEIKHERALLSFLCGTSIKLLANANRKIQEERILPLHHEIQRSFNGGEEQLEVEDLYKALSKLSDVLKETLILFEISGFSIREIAELQHLSEDAVKQRLTRGRKELAQLLAPVKHKHEAV